jgi:hypothetical protein
VDLETIAGPEWAGWVFAHGLLFAPEWRHGLHPGDIRAVPYLRAAASDYRLRAQRAETALQDAEAARAIAEKACAFYRRQCVLEAQYGLPFALSDEQQRE